ncbi:hypothetical protein [Nocardioides iriomotensis]|uniref:Uncharacterized protein n=1 Tax=Nocardioides iriomotensis TaxID=715784 RepID=A0A4Q5IUC4_9ACTN|nr:hypothetical protein [Nocardioides iriomotensis]RYU09497.1 hypothetical protein ETU37_20815 [Nocardioides iriomotensis]
MRTVLAAMLLVAGAGCSAADEAPAPTSTIHVSLGFTQLLPDEGTPKGLLRVVNEGDEPLAVTGAGLRWSGYGPEFTRAQDATLAPGQTLDLHVLLPEARCDEGQEPISGVVSTAGETKVQRLTTSGQQFLRRLWKRGCDDALVADNVAISYAPGWRTTPDATSLDGALRLVRRTGGEPVTVTYADGSVLYDLVLPGEVTIGADQRSADVPLSIQPGNRCDEHAIGQATAPFAFRVGVRVGVGPDATETLVLVPPPVRVQAQATRMLLAYCRA